MNLALTPWLRLPLPRLAGPSAPLRAQPVAARGAVPSAPQELAAGATFPVTEQAGATIHCLGGCLWLTHDGDCKDIVLAAGQGYRSTRPGRLLVHALEASRFAVVR
ncbi:MAG: DUF2917 domain-containing protein [Betaproteobacteria bacterium]